MDHCYVKFSAFSPDTISRTRHALEMLASMKSGERERDEAAITALLSSSERSYFTEFTPDEWVEWNEHWRLTPVDFRLSAEMITPQWDIGSMYDAFWNGEYELVGISEEGGAHFLAFEPHAYPFGGTGCMVALVECFGHTVLGIEDGTGYRKYQKRPVWRPKNSRAEANTSLERTRGR